MLQLIDDQTASNYYNEIDTATGDDLQSKTVALEAWANNKKAERTRQEWDHVSKVFTDFDNYSTAEGLNDFDEESRYQYANRKFIANQTGDTPENQMFVYPSKRDEVTDKMFGKTGLSEKETFDLFKNSIESRNASEEALRELPGVLAQGVLKRAGEGKPFDEVDSWFAFSDWKERHADKLASMPKGWETAMLDSAVKLHTRTEQLMDDVAPESKRAMDTLMKFTRPEDAANLPEADRADVANLAKDFSKLTPEQRDGIYATLSYAAEANGAGMGKGFWEKVGEGIARGGGNIYDDAAMTLQDRQARQNIAFFQDLIDKPQAEPDMMQTADSIQMQRDMAQKGLEENKQRLGELRVMREIRDLAQGRIDPIKTEMDGVLGSVVQGAYDFSHSAAYTGMAMVPYVGLPAVMGALANSNYLRMLDQYPDMDADAAFNLSLAIAGPQAIAERFQAGLLLGKLPFLGKAMKKLTDARVPLPARIGLGYGAVVGLETGTELVQEAMPIVADQLASAVREDMPEFDAGKAWGEYRDQAPKIFYSMLWGGLMGGGAVGIRELERSGVYMRNLQELEMHGITGEAAQNIAAEQDQDAATALYREAWDKRSQEDIQAGIAKRAAMLDAAQATQANPDLPTRRIEENPDGTLTHIIEQNGQAIYSTNDPAAADLALVNFTRMVDRGRITGTTNGIVEALSFFNQVNEAAKRGDDIQKFILENTPRNLLDEYEANPTEQNLDNLFKTVATIGQNISEPAELANFPVLASNQGALADGIFKSVIRIYEGATGDKVVRDVAQDNLKRAIAEGRIKMEWVRENLNQIIPQIESERISQKLRTETDTDVIESFSDVALAYMRGNIRDEQIPAGLRGFLRRMAIVVKDIFRRAYKLKRLVAEGKVDSNFESFLADSVGLNQQTLADTVRDRAKTDIITDGGQMLMDFSIGSRASAVSTDTPSIRASNATITGPANYSIGAFHGTPHKVDKFSTGKIGTGEGAQAYGWGLYFAENRGVGEQYRNALAQKDTAERFAKDKRIQAAVQKLDSARLSSDAATIKTASRELDLLTIDLENELSNTGNLYTVDLDAEPEDLLDWDKPLSEQSPKVQAALKAVQSDHWLWKEAMAGKGGEQVGAALYKTLTATWPDSEFARDGIDPKKKASEALLAAGIPGIRYLDGGSRSEGQGTYNYVAFDENLIKITEENGNRIAAADAFAAPVTGATNYSIGSIPFKEWFGDWENDPTTASKVVDSDGKPMVVYHGTTADMSEFTKEGSGEFGRGHYFAPRADSAAFFGGRGGESGLNIMPVYLSMKRPLRVDVAKGGRDKVRAMGQKKIREQGYDGIIATGLTGEVQYVVFEPTQIKSATGNRGTFNPRSADINYSIGQRSVLSEIDRVLDMPENPTPVPTAAQEGGKVRSIAKLFHTIMDGDKIDYGAIDEKGMAERISQAGDRILDVLLRASYEFPNFASWYESRLKMALDIFTQLDPDVAKPDNESALLITLAITSNGADVATQTEDGWDVYSHWKSTGKLAGSPEKRGALRGAETENKLGLADRMAGILGGYANLGKFLNRKGTVAELRKAMAEELGDTFTKETILDLTNGELVSEVIPFSLVFGAKLGSFFNNMSGDFSTITMDRWFMRTFGRTMGTQLIAISKDVMAKKDARLKQALKGYKGDLLKRANLPEGVKTPRQIAEVLGKFFQKKENRSKLSKPENEIRLAANDLFKVADGFVLNEAPDNGTHRRWIRAAMTNAIEKFNAQTQKPLVPAEAQALLWYYEKLVHETYGSRQKDASPDYASAANKLFVRETGVGSDRFRDSDGIKRRSGGGRSQAFGGVSVSGQSSANYSIASQSEIDRVNRALGGMNRGPDERLKVYQRAKAKFSKLMAWNSDELAAMADTGSDDSQIRRTQILQALGELDGILSVLPPEVRGRVGGYTKLAGIAPMDVLKDGVKVSEVSGMNGAIISAWMREGQNIGQAGKQVSLPPGYTATENLSTKRADKAIADFLRDRIKKIDTELEKVLAREYTEAITKAVKQSRPKAGDNGVRKSTLGAETQKFADMVLRATLLDDEATPKRMAEIEAALTNPDATTEDISALSEEWSILNTFGDLDNRSSETLAQGLDWLKGQLQMGREAWRIKEQARIDEQRARARQTIEWLGKGTAKKRNATKTKSELASDLANHYLLSHANFEQFVTAIFPPEIAAKWSERLRKADEASQTAEIRDRKGILDAVRAGAKAANMSTADALLWLKADQKNSVAYLEGRMVKDERIAIDLAQKIVTGEADRSNLSDADVETLLAEIAALPADTQKEFVTIKRVIFRGKEDRLHMSRGKAIQYLLSWNQPDVQIKMRKEGWTDESAADLNALVNDPVSREVMAYAKELYGKGAGIVNPVYSRMFGMNMPQVKNYAPTRFLNAKDTKDIGLDGSATATGTTPGFAKSRVTHSAKIAPEDALTVMQGHIAQQAHWVHFAELAREFRAILSNPEVRESIKQTQGESVLKDAELWADQLEQRGGNKARESTWMNTILGTVLSGKAISSLGFNLKTLAMQLENTIRFGLALDMKQIVSALSNPSAIVEDIQTVWDSPAIQNRLEGGATAEARFLFSRYAGKPNFAAKIAEASMTPINWLDSAGTSISSAIVYRANLNDALASGMPENLAKQAALNAASEAIYRFAQPVSFGQKSIMENNGNVLAKTFFLFMSDPRLKTAILADAARGLATGRGNASEHIRRIVTVELMAIVSHVISSAFRDTFSDDDDEEIWSLGGFAKAILLAPLQGFFFAGTVGELAISTLTGQKFYTSTQNPLVTSMEQAIRAGTNMEDAINFDDPEAMFKEWNNIFRSMALTPGMAAPAVLLNMIKPAYGLYQNATTED